MAEVTTKRKKAANQRKRILMFLSLSVATLALCTCIIIGIVYSLITEGVYDFGTEIEDLAPMPESESDILAYAKQVIDDAQDNSRVFVNQSCYFNFDGDKFEVSGNDVQKNFVNFMLKNVSGEVDEALYPEDYRGEFGDKFEGYPIITLQDSDIVSAECTIGRYEEHEVLVDEDFYYINLNVNGVNGSDIENAHVDVTFNMDNVDEVLKKFESKAAESYKIDELDYHPDIFTLSLMVNRFTEKIVYVELIRRYNVTLALSGAGDFESLGSIKAVFPCYVKERSEYVYAGITFGSQEMTLDKGEQEMLAVNAVLNDYSDYELVFESSDPSICTVDELGYVTGVKRSAKPVTISAKLTYLGNVYEADCIVNVRKQVKKIVVAKSQLSLASGEAADLTAVLKPKDATVQDIIWISEDESVAVVTGTGCTAKITAVGAGKTKIIAVTADGSLRDSCTVTVAQ